MKPDFSPAMLKAFLYARAVAREEFARTEAEQIAARKRLADELVKVTGLPLSMVRAGMSGRLTDPSARAAIWAVLGHHPCDFGIVLSSARRPARGQQQEMRA